MLVRLCLSALLPALVLTACAAPPAPSHPAPSPVSPPVEAAPAPKPAAPPRALVFFVGPERDAWLAGPAGTPPRALGFKAREKGGGQINLGGDDPMLSPDGQWIAYLDDHQLWMKRLDGSVTRKLTTHPTSQVRVLLSGWSPDSQSFLFHQSEIHCEDDCPAFPRDLSQGFYLATTRDPAARFVPKLEGFDVWEPDSQHVLYQAGLGSGQYELRRGSLNGAAFQAVQKVTAPFGFSQLTMRGDEIAFVMDNRVQRSHADGSAHVDVTPKGEFAEHQWPHHSPDGKHLAYHHKPKGQETLDVVELSTSKVVRSLDCNGCSFAWESPTSLVVLAKEELRRVDLASGASAVIAPKVAVFAVAGDNAD